ncbi:hypothetical protein BJY04DRAFT_225040 [Aspergillus karnatakaensis]|uniref:uncharacterized protein n=1 Tax=Aspergillus karnatakaensis TaxID=1810916 RepID=UPI003CCD2A1D
MPHVLDQNMLSTSSHSRSKQKRSPYDRSQERALVEIRPKGAVVIMAGPNRVESRRQQHAQTQKCQRDRIKAALDEMARIMKMGGVKDEGTSGTKAQLLETAVEYIQQLQEQVGELRGASPTGSGHAGHATQEVGAVEGTVSGLGGS